MKHLKHNMLEILSSLFNFIFKKDGLETLAKKMWMSVKTALVKMEGCVWICLETFYVDVQWVGFYKLINIALPTR